MRYLTFLFICSLLAGCASTLPNAGINQTYKHVGARVISPDEPGWYLMKHSDPGVVFGKKYPDESETAIANTYLFWLGELNSDDEFFAKVIEGRKRNDNVTRFKQLDLNYEKLSFKDSSCLKYSSIAEDHGDKGLDSTEFQYFKSFGYVCRTKLNQTTALLMEVSHRSDSKGIPENLTRVAQQFFENIELTDD